MFLKNLFDLNIESVERCIDQKEEIWKVRPEAGPSVNFSEDSLQAPLLRAAFFSLNFRFCPDCGQSENLRSLLKFFSTVSVPHKSCDPEIVGR